jgi:hypothetical protein
MMTKWIKKLRWSFHATEAIASFAGPAYSSRTPTIFRTAVKNLITVPAEWNGRNNPCMRSGLFIQPVTANISVEHSFRSKPWHVHVVTSWLFD